MEGSSIDRNSLKKDGADYSGVSLDSFRISGCIKKRSLSIESTSEVGKKRRERLMRIAVEKKVRREILENRLERRRKLAQKKEMLSRQEMENQATVCTEEVRDIDPQQESTREVEMEIDSNTKDKREEKRSHPADKKVKMILENGKWYYEEDLTEKVEGKGRYKNKYQLNHKGEILLELNVEKRYKLKNKLLNNLKIASFIHKEKIRAENMKAIGFNKTEVKFRNIIEANRCLDVVNKQQDKKIEARIPGRMSRRKGVITEWEHEMPLHELAEALDNDKNNVIQIERMKRRYYNKEKKVVRYQYTDNIIVMFAGNELPTDIGRITTD